MALDPDGTGPSVCGVTVGPGVKTLVVFCGKIVGVAVWLGVTSDIGVLR